MLRETFTSELKLAMKAGERRRVDTIRMITAALKESVLITPDPRMNSLIVSGPVEYMGLLDQIIRRMDASSPQKAKIKVFALQNADARQLALVLTQLFRMTQKRSSPCWISPINLSIYQNASVEIRYIRRAIFYLKTTRTRIKSQSGRARYRHHDCVSSFRLAYPKQLNKKKNSYRK